MNVLVYFRADAMLIFRRNIYATLHQHHGIQITLAPDQPFEAELDQRREQHRFLVINSDYPHRVVGQGAWIATLLLNPETHFAKNIQRQILKSEHWRSLDLPIPSVLRLPDVQSDCQPLDLYLNTVGAMLIPPDTPSIDPDSRIIQALKIVEQRDYRIAAKDLSRRIYLSESRLIHLFKNEVGIPLRRYLLWQRLMRAAKVIAQGENFTFAAHESGFTDSAHLSRTFSMMFGLRISDMFGDRESIRVIFCDNQTKLLK